LNFGHEKGRREVTRRRKKERGGEREMRGMS
jgi:hypothetical protein